MDIQVRDKWLLALRSGEYVQGRDKLRAAMADEPDKYCCLGVLCDIYLKERSLDWVLNAVGTLTADNATGYPSLRVQDWAGLSHDQCVAFGRLNDGGRANFIDVANAVELL